MADTDRNPVEVLAEEYLTLFRRGKEPPLEEFAAEHPEHAPTLREVLPTMLTLERAKRDKESTGSGRARLGVPKLERLGDFEIMREVGRGGMGIVFEATQQSLGRRVALKVLPRQALLTGHQLQRFEREAQTAARLHHTNIVPVYGTGERDGFHFYAMQFIDGRGLDKVIAELESHQQATTAALGPSPAPEAARSPSTRGQDYWRQVARIGLQVADALHYAHGQGTLHRDVKPSNLLLDENGTVWITDFGLAKALEQEGLTHSGDLLGTLQYMPPEQFRGQYDVRSEVYALGLTLYELLTRRPAFTGRNRSEILERIQNTEPAAPRRIDPLIPPDLETIVLKAIAKDPAHRYRDAGELGEDLERYLEDRPILARRASTAEQLWRWCRRNKAMASLAAATLIAVLGAGIVGWTAFVLEREASERAEGNLTLAMAAFEDVFDTLAGPDPFQAIEEDPETGEYEPVLRSAVSEQNAQLLLGLLDFYDRFAQQNAGNRELLEDAARAYRRVGEIQQRLGREEEAEAAYGKALELFESLEGVDVRVELAALHNELGRLARGGRRIEEHGMALELLEGGREPIDSRRGRFERARTHHLMASTLAWFGRPPGRRERVDRDEILRRLAASREHSETAHSLIDGLMQEEPENPEFLLLKARCLAAPPRGLDRDEYEGRSEAFAQAIALLEGLLDRFPNADPYRFELAETLLSRSRFGEAAEALPYVERAVSHAGLLADANPDNRAYESLLGGSLWRLGRTLKRVGRLSEAENAWRRVGRLAKTRWRYFARRDLMELWLETDWTVVPPEEAGDEAAVRGHREERLRDAREWTVQAIEQLESEEPDEERDRRRRVRLGGAYQTLARISDELGDAETAAAARAKVEALRPRDGADDDPRRRGRRRERDRR